MKRKKGKDVKKRKKKIAKVDKTDGKVKKK
jgi:hypothetical protein